MIHVVTHCKAENDVNGNPRKLYMVSEVVEGHRGGDLVAVIDEGFEGSNAYRKHYPEAVLLSSVNISAKEYKRLRNLL